MISLKQNKYGRYIITHYVLKIGVYLALLSLAVTLFLIWYLSLHISPIWVLLFIIVFLLLLFGVNQDIVSFLKTNLQHYFVITRNEPLSKRIKMLKDVFSPSSTYMKGLDGETEVLEVLLKSLPDSYVVIRELVIPRIFGGDVDLLIISSKGIYLLEVKNHSQLKPESVTDAKGKLLRARGTIANLLASIDRRLFPVITTRLVSCGHIDKTLPEFRDILIPEQVGMNILKLDESLSGSISLKQFKEVTSLLDLEIDTATMFKIEGNWGE